MLEWVGFQLQGSSTPPSSPKPRVPLLPLYALMTESHWWDPCRIGGPAHQVWVGPQDPALRMSFPVWHAAGNCTDLEVLVQECVIGVNAAQGADGAGARELPCNT